MLIRRIVLAALIIASGVFASFFGGAARALFYIFLAVPVISLFYTFYVYLRFRIYQNAEYKVIVKGEKTPYYFVLSNEDFMSYADVRVTFLDGFSEVQNMSFSQSYHLIPSEKIRNNTEILCKYRGEYCIGVKDVIVTDFLRLFSIRYPAPSTISMSVLPRIAELDKLELAPVDSDAKLIKFLHSKDSELIDSDMNKYVPGDSAKLINWKVSAKRGELFSRQSSDTQNKSIVFIMDMTDSGGDEYEKCVFEDKVIESALATANYLVKKGVPVYIAYEQDEIFVEYINNYEGFRAFYEKCGNLKFKATYSPTELYEATGMSFGSCFAIFAVFSLSEELCAQCEGIIESGGDAAILLFGEDEENMSQALDSRIVFRKVLLSDEAADVLGGRS